MKEEEIEERGTSNGGINGREQTFLANFHDIQLRFEYQLRFELRLNNQILSSLI